MQALSLDAPGKIRMVALSDPSVPGPAEALIRIRQVGICGTDYHALHGNRPFLPIHEFLDMNLVLKSWRLGARSNIW